MLTRLTISGTVGSLLIMITSWWVGAVPHSFQGHPPGFLGAFRISSLGPRIAFYIGVAILVGSWVVLGRYLRGHEAGSLTLLSLAWLAPMAIAMPIGSRDLWAYAAQGNLDHHGLDPYKYAPADLPGVFLDNVSLRWIHATTPYGPLWLIIGKAVAAITGGHVQVAVFVLRIPALIGLLLILWALPGLARRYHVRADLAVWLTVANPLTLVLGLGGGHNDLLMTGLMVVAVVVTLTPGSMLRTLAIAAVLMSAAAAVKSPAAIGLAFIVPLWLRAHPGADPRRRVRRAVEATAAALASALTAFAVISVICGHGLGWVSQVSSKAPVISWMSFPTAGAMVAKLCRGTSVGALTLDQAMEDWRTGGLVLAALIIAALWLLSMKDAIQAAQRDRTMAYLGAAMLVIVVLGPAVQPWYYGWPLPFAVLLTLSRRVNGILVGISVGLLVMIRPLGTGMQMEYGLIPITALSALIGWLAVKHSAPSNHDADRARAGVGTDHRADL